MPTTSHSSAFAVRVDTQRQDLLVEFEQGATPSLLDLADIERELSDLMGGRRVDLRTPEDLSRYFRDEVVRGAEVQYESAATWLTP